jgi:hypothetical protein
MDKLDNEARLEGDTALRPNWIAWLAHPEMMLWQCIALSMSIEPSRAQGRLAHKHDDVRLRQFLRLKPALYREFHERLGHCDRATSSRGPIHINPYRRKEMAPVRLDEVARFLVLSGYSLPAELEGLVTATDETKSQKNATAQGVSTAPITLGDVTGRTEAISTGIRSENEMKRTALITSLEREYSSIASFLGEASRPGYEDLKAANVRRGWWDIDKVRQCLRTRGLIHNASNTPTLEAAWNRNLIKDSG